MGQSLSSSKTGESHGNLGLPAAISTL